MILPLGIAEFPALLSVFVIAPLEYFILGLNSKLNIKQRQKYPILKTLLIFQTIIAIIGFAITALSLYFFAGQQTEKALSAFKQKITPTISQKYDQWSAWKIFELHHALKESLNQTKLNLDLQEITLLMVTSDLNLQSNQIYFAPTELEGESNDFGVLITLSDQAMASLSPNYTHLTWPFLLLVLLFFTLIFYTAFFILNRLYKPIQKFYIEMDKVSKGVIPFQNPISATGEIKYFLDYIQKTYQQAKRNQEEKTLIQITKQLTHDIRSPIAALSLLLEKAQFQEQDEKNLLRDVIIRIEGISQDLQKKVKKSHKVKEPISIVIRKIIKEKQIQFGKDVEIIFQPESDTVVTCVEIDRDKISRVLSNIFQNSFEAFEDGKGKIEVKLKKSYSYVQIQILDNGKGIPKNLMSEVFKEGSSFGKDKNQYSGSGLGLFHAKKTIDDHSGKIQIDSREAMGTTITLSLPICDHP